MADEPEDGPEEILPAETATVDAASPEGLRTQKRKQKRANEDSEDFWRMVFTSEAGRREMWTLLGEGNLHAFSVNFAVSPNGSPYTEAAWYHRALQDFGLQLYLKWQSIDPEGVKMMHIENDPRFKPRPRPTRRKTDA